MIDKMTITMTFFIWHMVVSVDCLDCFLKIENGEYHYIAQVTPGKTYDNFSWKNDTNHPVATKRDSSISPVKASSHEMLVSSCNLGNLTLKRIYDNENGKIEEEIVLCCVSPHADNILGNTTPSVSPGGGQPGMWTAVACGVAALLAVAGAVAVAVTLSNHFWKQKNKEGYTVGTPFPASTQDTPV